MVELEAMVQEAEKKVGLKATLEAGVLELKEKLFGALGDLEAHNEKLEALHRRERQQNVNYKAALEAAMARISTLQHDLAKVRKLSMEREEKLVATGYMVPPEIYAQIQSVDTRLNKLNM